MQSNIPLSNFPLSNFPLSNSPKLESLQFDPLVAILRGITPEQIPAVCDRLVEDGWRTIEIPLNSPQAFHSIELVATRYPNICCGAGTVLTEAQVHQVANQGGTLIVSPNTNPEVIRATKALNLISLPGCLTPTEAFSAIDAGADGLKIFPANAVRLSVINSLSDVLPQTIPLFAVGGINHLTIKDYAKTCISGFGVGGQLYRPQYSLRSIAEQSRCIIKAFREFQAGRVKK